MHGLRTSSILILDDKDVEALEIQKALAFEGIGSVLVPGAVDALRPDTQLTGIRVAVLDIDLGQGTNSPDRVRHTVGIFESLMDKDNGPYVAVVWTQNAGDYKLFSERLHGSNCPPVSTVSLEKTEVLGLSVKGRADKILGAVETAVSGAAPIEFANLWEQVVRDAANATVTALAPLKPGGAGSTRAMEYLAALLDSAADTRALNNNDESMRALLAGMNPVHFDKVEERSARMTEDELAVVQPIRENATAGSSSLSEAALAELNAALLLDQRVSGFGPGRIYSYSAIENLQIGPALPNEQDIRARTVEPGHLDRAAGLPVVFLEVSAPCDHQQGNVEAARLIAGVGFAASRIGSGEKAMRVHPRTSGYLRQIKPLSIAHLDGLPNEDVVLVWNARYPVSISVQALSNVDPIGRLREPLLADIRAWLGYQAGRPGYPSA